MAEQCGAYSDKYPGMACDVRPVEPGGRCLNHGGHPDVLFARIAELEAENTRLREDMLEAVYTLAQFDRDDEQEATLNTLVDRWISKEVSDD